MTLAHDLPAGQKPPAGLRLSYDEFLHATFDHHHYEWVEGKAIEMAGVEDEHAQIVIYLIRVLGDWIEAKQAGALRGEPVQMKTGPDLPGRSPDLMFIASENMGRIERLCVRGPADLVIEVISPGSRRTDLIDKLSEYERGGVKEYWIIDPFRRRVDCYSLINGRYVMLDTDDDGRLHSKVLHGVWFRDAWFFERPAKTTVLNEWGIGAA